MTATTTRDEFSDAIHPHHGALLRSALALTRDLSEARDLVQDSLERALREWARFTPGTNVRAWVTAILSRLFIDGWRKRRCRPRYVSLTDIDPPAVESDQDPEGEAWEAVSRADIDQAVAALRQPFRRIFELSAFQHLSYAEISAQTGIPVSTVGTRLLRARRQLRALILDRLARLPDNPTIRRSCDPELPLESLVPLPAPTPRNMSELGRS